MELPTAQPILDWIFSHHLPLGITAFVLILILIFERLTTPVLRQSADDADFKDGTAAKAIRILRLILLFLAAVILTVTWGIDFSGLIVFATTALTLIGVALFASWSLLSNVTSYFILIVQPAFARGRFVRVIDGDNYIEGKVTDLTIFSTELTLETGEIVAYPNNLLLARPTIVDPQEKLDGIGKITKKELTALPPMPDNTAP